VEPVPSERKERAYDWLTVTVGTLVSKEHNIMMNVVRKVMMILVEQKM
jgi:hypothetical protein